MGGFRQLADMSYSDDEILDRLMPDVPEPPEYPPELSFTVPESLVEECGAKGECQPGHMIDFAAMVEATAVSRRTDGCRIEGEITMLSLGDGQLTELPEDQRPSICLLDGTMEKLDLDDEASVGDLLHVIGEARVEGTGEHRYSDGRTISFQIVGMCCIEDEDREGRDG